MDIVNSIIHPQKFLGLTDLRAGTIILAAVNFILILTNFGVVDSWRWIITLAITVLSLICTGLGCWGAFNNNAQHVTWYFYYCFVNLIFSILNCVLSIIHIHIWSIFVNLVYLVVA
eukprot:jgi/Orpsp1_1/1179818/evm.model.c7180000070874.1